MFIYIYIYIARVNPIRDGNRKRRGCLSLFVVLPTCTGVTAMRTGPNFEAQ